MNRLDPTATLLILLALLLIAVGMFGVAYDSPKPLEQTAPIFNHRFDRVEYKLATEVSEREKLERWVRSIDERLEALER